MPSPFPGMDPYLEPHWPDVHVSLIGEIRRALNASLPDDLVASSEERVAVESRPDWRSPEPDVRVFDAPDEATVVTTATLSAVDLAAPFTATMDDPKMERFIRILEIGSERDVTVIEVLSPTNKRNPGLRVYRSKRMELLDSGVNVVEIDLIRQGNWRRVMHPLECPPGAVATYRAAVRLASDPATIHLWPIPLGNGLPDIPVPLRADDPEVRVDLQALIDEVYRTGRYAQRLRYDRPLERPAPPLRGAEAEVSRVAAGPGGPALRVGPAALRPLPPRPVWRYARRPRWPSTRSRPTATSTPTSAASGC